MAMANMNLIGVFVTKLWPVQALACGGGDGGGATKTIISPTFSNFGDIMILINNDSSQARPTQHHEIHYTKYLGCLSTPVVLCIFRQEWTRHHT